jgi:hypothetical protein
VIYILLASAVPIAAAANLAPPNGKALITAHAGALRGPARPDIDKKPTPSFHCDMAAESALGGQQ